MNPTYKIGMKNEIHNRFVSVEIKSFRKSMVKGDA